jgi:hypothetical protein
MLEEVRPLSRARQPPDTRRSLNALYKGAAANLAVNKIVVVLYGPARRASAELITMNVSLPNRFLCHGSCRNGMPDRYRATSALRMCVPSSR